MLMSLQWIHWTDTRDLISAICLGSLLLSRDMIVLHVLSGRFIWDRWGLLELERVTEDSESWFSARTVTDKFVSQSIATFATAHLQPWWKNKQTNHLDPLTRTRKWIKELYLVSSGFLLNFRDRIFVESLIKCGPGGLMLVFGCTKEWILSRFALNVKVWKLTSRRARSHTWHRHKSPSRNDPCISPLSEMQRTSCFGGKVVIPPNQTAGGTHRTRTVQYYPNCRI